jgi:protein-tyrosine phosphatase
MPATTPAPGALPGPRQPYGTYKICLVCLGNICRSPMAEVVLREMAARSGLAGAVSVESAGTGDWHVGERMYGAAREELARRGYDGSAHRARQIQASWLAGYDLVVAMDRANLATLGRLDPAAQAAGRIRLLRSFDPALSGGDAYQGDVPDPYGGSAGDFELAFDLIQAGAQGLTAQLAALLDVPAPGRT